MSTPEGDGTDGTFADKGTVPTSVGETSPPPITTPDSARHSAPDPEAVRDTRRPAGTSPDGIAHTKAAATWTGLVVGVLVAVVLLIFILQNLDSVPVQIFAWTLDVPLGVGLLLSALAGALVMALAGGVRILQVRRAAKRK